MSKSEILFEKANKFIPGGVNSPVRAFKNVGGKPLFFEKGVKSYLFDVDGKSYIDYVGSWGALILGHAHPKIIDTVTSVLANGTSFGAPCELEIKLSEKIISLMPSIEKIRMVNSGTEATMTAVRLARGYTGKKKIIKFGGCYHGHNDSLLANAGSGLLTLGIPSSPGIPENVTKDTLTATFNDLEEVEKIIKTHEFDIAGVIVEPVAGNMGMIKPTHGFLEGLKKLCDEYNALLIFDEVMTGFRVGLGGAQEHYKITPHITTLGKVIGGGLPVGAVGGSAQIMDCLAPQGEIYQAGTLSGNPLVMACGLKTLEEVETNNFYEQLSFVNAHLIAGLREIASSLSIPFCGDYLGGMFGFCFSELKNITNFNDVANSDENLFKIFFHGMLEQGVYFAPSMFEAGFISSCHTIEDINNTLDKASHVLTKISRKMI